MRKSAPHFRIFVIGGNLPWLLNLQVGVGLSWFPHVLLLWILDEKSGSNSTSTMDVQLANNVSLGKCFGCACTKPTWSFKLWQVLLAWFPHSQHSIWLALVKLSLNHLSTTSPHRKPQGGVRFSIQIPLYFGVDIGAIQYHVGVELWLVPTVTGYARSLYSGYSLHISPCPFILGS